MVEKWDRFNNSKIIKKYGKNYKIRFLAVRRYKITIFKIHHACVTDLWGGLFERIYSRNSRTCLQLDDPDWFIKPCSNGFCTQLIPNNRSEFKTGISYFINSSYDISGIVYLDKGDDSERSSENCIVILNRMKLYSPDIWGICGIGEFDVKIREVEFEKS